MIYNNLIALLLVVLLLSTSSVPAAPLLPLPGVGALFLFKGLLFYWAVRRLFRPGRISQVSGYLRAEQQGTILAVAFLAIDIYLLDCKYYIVAVPLLKELPVLADLGGLVLFFAYLVLMWGVARQSYIRVTDAPVSHLAFLSANVKTNLAILLPWVALSLLAEFLQRTSIPLLQQALSSPWGEGGIFLAFFLVLVIGFPAVMVRLWGCTPLPAGPTRQRIETLCASQRLHYREIMSWPLFGGQMLSAAVLGVSSRFRYLLVTPALLEALTEQELEAVVAHEIGHVKRFHLQLYLFLFLGFGLMAQLSAYPVTMALLNTTLFYRAMLFLNVAPGKFIALFSALPLLIIMLVYFRFFFGFFMRNFERQADLYSCRTMRDISPMVRVLEKIAWLSGNSRDLPSWHHFSIGQRIDFLRKCRYRPWVGRRHDLKVYASLVLYGLLLCGGGLMLWRLPEELLQGAPREKFAMAILEQKAHAEPQNYLWQQFLGDVHAQGQREAEAVGHYEQALTLAPANPELLNNFAWLLVTSDDQTVRNPTRGLALARAAAAVQAQGYILDTLATALWVNGLTEQALAAEMRAIDLDPDGREYYRQQMARFLAAPRPEASGTPQRRPTGPS